jgi:hypothetical protein
MPDRTAPKNHVVVCGMITAIRPVAPLLRRAASGEMT